MTNKEYLEKVERLRQIEQIVKDPQTGLDKIDGLIEETNGIVEECSAFLHGLKEKVDAMGGSEI